MKTIEIYKASPITKNEKVPSIAILIKNNLPMESASSHLSLLEAYEVYANDANLIANALFDSLPQGTMDRLIIMLMGRLAEKSGYMGITPNNKE